MRRYPSWYRHITLAMLALAYLAVVRSRLPGHTAPATTDLKGDPPWLSFLAKQHELIPFTLPEARRLVYDVALRSLAPPEAILHWSRWRRQHQARAMHSHSLRRWRYGVTAS